MLSSKQRGFTVVEISAVLLIMGLLSAALMPEIKSAMNDQKIQRDSAQVKTIGEAAVSYIEDNYNGLTAIATSTRPALINVAMLQSAGYLQANTSTTNSFGQSVCILVKQPEVGKLQALLALEGGDVINDIDSLYYAGLLGGAGGSVIASNPTQIVGAGGSWTLPLSDFNNLTNDMGQRCNGAGGNVQITPGRAVMGLWFTAEDKAAGLLYRDEIPSRPELNRMNTKIDMNSNDIERIGTLTANTGTINTFTSTDLTSTNVTTTNLLATNTASNSLRLTRAETVGGACTAGSIGRDSDGKILSCQSGMWATEGSKIDRGTCYWKMYGPPNHVGKGWNYASSCNSGDEYIAGMGLQTWGDEATQRHTMLCCKNN